LRLGGLGHERGNARADLGIPLGAGLDPHLAVVDFDHAAERFLHQAGVAIGKTEPRVTRKSACSTAFLIAGGESGGS
jgi:hypothetical protein